jgi:E3 ubiquitin-protein ligase EDD1
MCPLFMNRHVLKYILGRKIGWHDLAFFDPVMYESLRQLVLDSETKDASLMFQALDMNFCVELCAEEVTLSFIDLMAVINSKAYVISGFIMYTWKLFQN